MTLPRSSKLGRLLPKPKARAESDESEDIDGMNTDDLRQELVEVGLRAKGKTISDGKDIQQVQPTVRTLCHYAASRKRLVLRIPPLYT